MKNKIRITIILALTVMLTIGYTKVEAVLEIRSGVGPLVSTTASSFFEKIRGMEKIDGAFGLNATFVTESGTYKETSGSNNIDVHMAKNTEWGIVAMMSASEYGSGNGNVTNTYDDSTNIYNVTASTTGNMSGVFGTNGGPASLEYVSGGIVGDMDISYAGNIKNAENRYVDKYEIGELISDFNAYIPGDATFETMKFTGGGGTFVAPGSPVFYRGYNSVFDSSSANGNGYGDIGSRVGVWSGLGL